MSTNRLLYEQIKKIAYVTVVCYDENNLFMVFVNTSVRQLRLLYLTHRRIFCVHNKFRYAQSLFELPEKLDDTILSLENTYYQKTGKWC